MKKFNKQAFGRLTPDEQSSLALQKVHGKSTWEVGSILNKSHYKYLEIRQRAERFFELFTIHYDTYGKLIPEGLTLDDEFAQYLTYTIEKRWAVKKAALEVGTKVMEVKKDREAYLEKEILKLKNSKSLYAQNLYTVIMEFDRYNNFRILPLSVQEPSAFKRRNKTRFRKHLNISTTIHPYVLMRIKELYEVSNKGAQPKRTGYIALTNYSDEDKAFEKIIPIPVNDRTVRELSSISIYVFPKEEYAIEYINLVRGYILALDKDPKMGLKFWPKFRVIIKDSLNYNEINNIAPSRRGLLSALKDLDDRHMKARKIAQNNNSYN